MIIDYSNNHKKSLILTNLYHSVLIVNLCTVITCVWQAHLSKTAHLTSQQVSLLFQVRVTIVHLSKPLKPSSSITKLLSIRHTASTKKVTRFGKKSSHRWLRKKLSHLQVWNTAVTWYNWTDLMLSTSQAQQPLLKTSWHKRTHHWFQSVGK